MSQTYQDFELIIIDDGSSDSSVETIRSILYEFPNHNILLVTRENVGLCKTLNEGLRMSKGEFFSYIGSDDLWFPQKLELQMEALLSKSPEFGACYSDCFLIDDSGKRIGRFSDLYDYREGNIYEDLVWNRFVPHSPTNLFRRSVIDQVGGFNEDHAIEDRDLWIRLSRLYKVGYVETPLGAWRTHGNNTGKNIDKMYNYGLAVLDAVLTDDPKFLSLEKKLRASLDASRAYACFAAGLKSEARRSALSSIRNNPVGILPWRVLLSSAAPEKILDLLRSIKHLKKKGS
jgi:glycosyltransferase involved in cell wall biosynthesis